MASAVRPAPGHCVGCALCDGCAAAAAAPPDGGAWHVAAQDANANSSGNGNANANANADENADGSEADVDVDVDVDNNELCCSLWVRCKRNFTGCGTLQRGCDLPETQLR